MKLRSKSILRWVIALILITVVGLLPKFTVTVWAHGPELGEDKSSGGGQKKEEKGPHGGQVVVFGDNHLEFTADHESGEIVLFLLDKNLKAVPVPESYSGVVYLNLTDGSKKTVTLKLGTEGQISHLEAETGIKEIGSFNAVVSLKIDEKRENLRFSWAPATHAHEEKK